MRMSVFDRYRSDAAFHELVDLLWAMLEKSEFTPTELREACHIAACKYEMTHIRPIVFTREEWDKIPRDIRERLEENPRR